MKKVTVSISALFLALGVLSGCGEKKEEAPKAEAPAASAAPAKEAAAPAANPLSAAASAVGDAAKSTADAAKGAAGAAVDATKDAAKATADAAGKAADATKTAAGAAVDATKDAAKGAADAAAGAATAAAGAVTGAVDGKKVFDGLCMACHIAGVGGSPKMGDKADWGPRIAKGKDALYASALNGRNNITPGKVMPPKGGNPALSDAEVKAAVDYMISQNK